MKVSIVVPSYEQSEYIRQCLESLKAQVIDSLEIIVYDASSKDGTYEIINEYNNDLDINIEDDLGQAHAINKGLRRCSGDIIGFLNSDDLLLPNCLQTIVEYWEENPSTDLLYGKAKYINKDGEFIGDYSTHDWNWEKFQGECFICQPGAFWSRRIMGKIGLLDERLHCSLDYDYWLRVFLAGGTIRHTHNYLACSRDYPETKTRHLRSKVFFENFKISLTRLGFVHASWISQYLDYLKFEKKIAWTIVIPNPGKLRNFLTRMGQNVSRVWARDVYITRKPYNRII